MAETLTARITRLERAMVKLANAQAHLTEVQARLAEVQSRNGREIQKIRKEAAEQEKRWFKEAAEREKRLDARIEKLVSAMGEWIRRQDRK